MLSRHLPERLLNERGERNPAGAGVPLGYRKQLGVHGDSELLLHSSLAPPSEYTDVLTKYTCIRRGIQDIGFKKPSGYPTVEVGL